MKRSKQIQAKFDNVVSAVLEALEGRVLLSAANNELSLGVITNSTPEPPPGYEARSGDVVSEGLLSAGISKVLYSVPEYFWYGGCSPTSGGMVMGYWDKLAYPNLFPGDASTQTTAVNDSIASPEYITDWKPKPDPSGPKHTDNCIADFMRTSRGDLNWGWTYLDNLDNGMEDYAAYKGYNYADAVNVGWGSLSFATIQAEINADRPFIINVDSDGSGEPDHSMACIGYRTSPSNQYAAYTTWSGMSGIQWFDWRDVSAGDDFGVHSVTFFRPSASRPDLAPSFANVAQEPLTWGDSFNYDYTVENYGGQNAGASTLKFYLSTDSTIAAASDYLLGSVAVPAIDAYGRSSGSPLLSLPNSPPTGFPTSGTLYIGIIVDANGVIAEGSENNNSNLGEFVSYDSLAVSTKADLVGKALTLDMPILNFGTTTASFSIMNQGQTNAGSFTVQFYLSQNSVISTSDTLIGTRVVSSLAKASTYQSTISLTVPKTDPFGGNGQYTIGMIIDALDTVDEGDEANNANRGIGIDRAAAQYGVKVFNATFDNGDGAMNIENDTAWAPEDGLWHITKRRASDLGHGGGNSMYYGQDRLGNYDIGDSAGVFLSKNIALPNSPIAVGFNYFSDVDSGASTDEIRLQVNDVVSGNFVTVLAKGSGLLADSGGKWRQATADLTPFAGSVVRLRWLFNTGNALNNTGEGWYVDDIALWALSNGVTVEGYRSLKYDSDYLHTPSSIQWAGDHDTFVFNEEQTGGSFSIKSVTLGSVTPALAVYDYETGAMLYMDTGTGAASEATITLPNTGSWNTYLVEVWDKEEDTTGNIDVAIDGTGVSAQSTMSVDGAGHAELLNQLINTDTDTDFYKVVAPVDASGNLTIEVTPHNDATAIPRMQIWLNNFSDAPDRVLVNNLGPTSAAFTGVKPGDTFYISISDNDFSGTGQFDLTADFSMALPATLTATAAQGFAYFHSSGESNDALNFGAYISPANDVDSYTFAGDGGWTGNYVITATAPAGSAVLPVLGVYDGTTGARIGVANSGVTATAQLTLSLSASAKYVVAVGDLTSTNVGDVIITIDGPTSFTPPTITLDGAGNGKQTAQNIGTNDTDFYRFTAPADTNGELNVRVVPTSAALDAAFALFDSTGMMLGQAYTAAAGVEDSLNVAGLVPGQAYYVSVMSRNHESVGNFDLFVDFDQVVPDVYPGGYDTWMVPNQFGDYSRNFSVSGADDWDGFLIASDLSTTAATFTATGVSGGGIPVIGLYDADTNARIAYNANLANAATVSFTADVSVWTRYYVIGTFKNGVAGTIRLVADMISPWVTAEPIDAAGQGSWNGLIDMSVDIDYYRFTAPSAASGGLTVNLVNSGVGLRSALVLFDDAGSFLDSDSAAASGGNATVQYSNVQALKEYVVAVTSHAFEGGMGSFTLNVSFDVYPSVITGTRLDDTVYVRSSAVDPSITQIYVNAPLTGAPTYAIPRAAWPTLTFNTLDGNDTLTVDFSNGNPIPSDGIVYNGGGGADSLAVIGSGAGVGSYKPSGTTPGSGEVIAEGSSIRFSNLEPVSVSGFASFRFTTPNSSADIVIDSPTAKTNRISGTSGGVAFESLSFANVSTLIIDVASNDVASSIDTVTVMSPGMVAAGLQKLGLDAGVGKNYFDLQAGSATLDTRYGIGGVYLSVTTHGTSQLRLPGSQTLASLSIKDSSKAGQLQGGGTVLQVGGLSIPGPGTLELYDNDLIVKNGNLSAISGLVKSARNGGAWDGTGVTSWFAKITPYTGLAAILNNTGGGSTVRNPFAGKATALTDVLVKYTWNGDANIDGKIDADDYFLIDSGYITQAKGYYNGDFNYDGIIDADDYFLIDSAYIGQSGILADGTIEEVEAASAILKARASDDADSSESVLAELFGTDPVV